MSAPQPDVRPDTVEPTAAAPVAVPSGRVEPDGGESAPPGVELVIFDCDGVLVDSEKIAVKVDARVLAGWAGR